MMEFTPRFESAEDDSKDSPSTADSAVSPDSEAVSPTDLLSAIQAPSREALRDRSQYRWPQTQTAWFKHLTTLGEYGGQQIPVGKRRSIAKRLHIELQSRGPGWFLRKYGAIIPHLNPKPTRTPEGQMVVGWRGGLPDGELRRLPELLAPLTGRDEHRLPDSPARRDELMTLTSAARVLGVPIDSVKDYVLRGQLDPVVVGDRVRLTRASVFQWRKALQR